LKLNNVDHNINLLIHVNLENYKLFIYVRKVNRIIYNIKDEYWNNRKPKKNLKIANNMYTSHWSINNLFE